jgi:hypothetical protein
MIIVRLISGLGNQLFQYSVGRELSIKHNVPLKLDLSFYDTQNLRENSLMNFNINAEIATSKEIDKYKLFNGYKKDEFYLYKKILPFIPTQYIKHFKEKTWWLYDSDIRKIGPNCYLDGYWQNYQYLINLSHKTLKDLTLKNNISNDARLQLEEMIKVNSVAIHVRRGDYVTDESARNYMGILPQSYFLDAIDFIKNKIDNPVFYIFSDDIEWFKKNIKLDLPTKFIENNPDYIDLELMQNCKHNIISNSSFSWWAAFLNKNVNKIVISPKTWVNNPVLNNSVNIQMPNWIKI